MVLYMYFALLNSGQQYPGTVIFTTQQRCNSIVIEWNSVSDTPCRIGSYAIEIGTNRESAPPERTSFSYPLDDDDCGETYLIWMRAISPGEVGSKTYRRQAISCTRK